ncbi:MAG: response regulator [Magnetococcus sp. MYC-9]
MSRILVVDDDEIMRTFLVAILRYVGYTVTESDNGLSGLKRLQTDPADLVITDIFMPEMDGLDLLTEILRNHPDSKIIAISGGYRAMNAQLTLKMAQGLGAIDIIAKPFQTSAVLKQVARALHASDTPARREVER